MPLYSPCLLLVFISLQCQGFPAIWRNVSYSSHSVSSKTKRKHSTTVTLKEKRASFPKQYIVIIGTNYVTYPEFDPEDDGNLGPCHWNCTPYVNLHNVEKYFLRFFMGFGTNHQQWHITSVSAFSSDCKTLKVGKNNAYVRPILDNDNAYCELSAYCRAFSSDDDTCSITPNSELPQAFCNVDEVLWYRTVICHRLPVQAVDLAFRDIIQNSSEFGRLRILFTEDFRTLSVMPGG